MGLFALSRRVTAAKKENDNINSSGDCSKLSLRPLDVLVGRGKGAYLSEGNRRYLRIVHSAMPTYIATTTNHGKIQISKDVVARVKSNGGRFMVMDSRHKLKEVSDQQARIKVAQAIRNRKRQISGETSSSEKLVPEVTKSERTAPAGDSDRTTFSHRSADDEPHPEFVGSHDKSLGVSFRSVDASCGSASTSQRIDLSYISINSNAQAEVNVLKESDSSTHGPFDASFIPVDASYGSAIAFRRSSAQVEDEFSYFPSKSNGVPCRPADASCRPVITSQLSLHEAVRDEFSYISSDSNAQTVNAPQELPSPARISIDASFRNSNSETRAFSKAFFSDHEATELDLRSSLQMLPPMPIRRRSNLSQEAAGYLSDTFSLLSLTESDCQSLLNLSSDSGR